MWAHVSPTANLQTHLRSYPYYVMTDQPQHWYTCFHIDIIAITSAPHFGSKAIAGQCPIKLLLWPKTNTTEKTEVIIILLSLRAEENYILSQYLNPYA